MMLPQLGVGGERYVLIDRIARLTRNEDWRQKRMTANSMVYDDPFACALYSVCLRALCRRALMHFCSFAMPAPP